jgi:BirA family biotin operon repressor/biotin-[acetyl-CoA-carboxylase] ligase
VDSESARRLGHTVRRYKTVGSTNDIAAELARSGCDEGFVVVAHKQTAGRGRHGHVWVSPPGGVYFSVVLRPHVPPERVHTLGFAAAVAVCEGVEAVCGLTLQTKWPNDLLCRGRKVGGVLVESFLSDQRVAFVVVGIGLNVNMPLEAFPPHLRHVATSVAHELGCPVDAEALLRAVLSALEERYRADNPAECIESWRRRAAFLGQAVRVGASAGIQPPIAPGGGQDWVTAIAEAVDSEGRLIIRLGDGSTRALASGDVHLVHWQV